MKTPRHSSQPAATWLVGSCLATCAAVWPTVGGWVDVRFAVAVAAIAWIFKGWVCGASASVGLLLGYAFLGSRIGDELGGGSLLALLVLGCVGIIEIVMLATVLQRTTAAMSSHAPSRRILTFLLGVSVLGAVGAGLEVLVLHAAGQGEAVSFFDCALGLGIASCLAAMVATRRAAHWFTYDRSSATKLITPLMIILVSFVAAQVTRQVWARLTDVAGTDLASGDPVIFIVYGIEFIFTALLLLFCLRAANDHFAMEVQRQRRESLLEAALDTTPGMSVVFDADFRVVIANKEVREKFSTKIPGLPVIELFDLNAQSGRARLVTDLLQQALDGGPGYAELAEDDTESTMRIFELEARPIGPNTKNPLGLLHSLDATERRNLAMRSAQSERMESLGALAGGLAHDFNNLLFVTLGNLQLMAIHEKVTGDEKLSKFVSRSITAVERGAEITKSLLAVARSQPLEESAVTLSELIKGLLPLVRQALGEGRQVTVDFADPTVQLMVDAGRLSSCILNLAFNSRDAMGPTGALRISARTNSDSGFLELSVADDGKGMPADVVSRAFEPFFTTKGVGRGTGLGLATVYAFAQQSGGTASLESRLGIGTTVTLSLPIYSGQQTRTAAVVQRRSGRRVVVADDEQSLAEMVASWLIDMGIDARFATSPKAALEMIEIFEPDVLVSDANFGEEVDGIQLARLAVAIVPDLAVIFMTGYSEQMRNLQELGERTLAKPFSREDLYSALSPFVAHLDGDASVDQLGGGENSL